MWVRPPFPVFIRVLLRIPRVFFALQVFSFSFLPSLHFPFPSGSLMNGLLDSVSDVERLSTLLYGGDKSVLRVVTDIGWGGVASAMGLHLIYKVLQECETAPPIFFASQALLYMVNSSLSSTDLSSIEQTLSCILVGRYRLLDSRCKDAIIRLLCAVVRRGFCEVPELRAFPLRVTAALGCQDGSPEEYISLSCNILTTLIDTIESTDSSVRSAAVNKRVNVLFRAECLLPVFRSVSRYLKGVRSPHNNACYSAVLLLCKVLLFDPACSFDDGTEDVQMREYPQEWAAHLVDKELFDKLWDLYLIQTGNARFFAVVLQSLEPLISLKASLYPSSEDQMVRLTTCLDITLSVMENRIHLDDSVVLFEFCRLLNRLKPNFTIEQMRKVRCYEKWMRTFADFTQLCLRNWSYARRVFLSLLSAWAKLVGSQTYCREKQTLLEELAPKVCQSYITSNQEQAVEFVQRKGAASFEDYSLDGEAEMLSLELGFASQLLRFCGGSAEECIPRIICHLSESLVLQKDLTPVQLSSVYEQLAWLVALSNSWLCSFRFSCNERATDCSVICACFKAVSYDIETQRSLSVSQDTRHHFHNSFISLLRTVWNILFLDRLDGAKKVRASLQAALNVGSQGELSLAITGLIVNEIMNGVYCCGGETAVAALNLFIDMVQSPSTVMVLKTLPNLNERLLFVSGSASNRDTKTYHRILLTFARIKAQIYMIGRSSESSTEIVAKLSLRDFRICGEECARFDETFSDTLVRVACSWRGTFRSCVGQMEYKLLLKQIFPELPLVMRHFGNQRGTACGVQLLRLLNEITENRSRRINFGANGVEGYHLFRFFSGSLKPVIDVLVEVLGSNDSRLVEWGIKCLGILFSIGRNILTGGYCNFGVLRLYGDESLPSCLASLWQAVRLLEGHHLQQYEKLARAFSSLSCELLRDVHFWFLRNLHIDNLLHVIHLLDFTLGCQAPAGLVSLSLEALGSFTSALCCSDYHESDESEQIMSSLLREDGAIFSRFLRLLLDIMLTKKCSTSVVEAPLRALVVLDRESFLSLGDFLCGLVGSDESREELREAFTRLQLCACESYKKCSTSSYTKEFQRFSMVVTRLYSC
uniref:Uncharacterized protein n=1 Tax=Trypanosoma congolense (strain IL3000) TaxID=1068625 RepID=G0US66_TRYCI|nr:conserved hypothetical protein [Trypanosoma congolense IL3000]